MSNDRQQRVRNRRQSTRLTQRAIHRALRELTPPSRARVRQPGGLGTTRPVLRVNTDVLARATPPTITFATDKTGRLAVSDIAGIARHEVGHFSIPVTRPEHGRFGGQHFSLQAAGARGELLSVSSGAVLRRAESASRRSFSRQVGLALKFRKTGTPPQKRR